jgi:hypothetical protein
VSLPESVASRAANTRAGIRGKPDSVKTDAKRSMNPERLLSRFRTFTIS